MSGLKEKNAENKFREFSGRYIPEIDKFIELYYKTKIENSEYPFMSEMYGDLGEYCGREGKRIRPLMLLAAYKGYKNFGRGNTDIISFAAAIEMMHSFLLIQDDVIDKSDLRRGKKSLHLIAQDRYSRLTYNDNIGNDTAIVLADVLFSNALEIISRAKINNSVRNEFIKIFSSTYEMTAWGQVLDVLHSIPRKFIPDDDISTQVSILKTAYYTIYYPILMGYVLTGRKQEKEMELIRDFSIPLGLAFQIRDDILGVFGKIEKTGKPDDSDLIDGKMTLLVKSTIENLKKTDKKEFIAVFTKKKKNKSEVRSLRNMIEVSGAREITVEKQGELLDQSRSRLSNLRISETSGDLLSGFIEVIRKI